MSKSEKGVFVKLLGSLDIDKCETAPHESVQTFFSHVWELIPRLPVFQCSVVLLYHSKCHAATDSFCVHCFASTVLNEPQVVLTHHSESFLSTILTRCTVSIVVLSGISISSCQICPHKWANVPPLRRMCPHSLTVYLSLSLCISCVLLLITSVHVTESLPRLTVDRRQASPALRYCCCYFRSQQCSD